MAAFPAGFFDRGDEVDDAVFYSQPRFVTHIDDGAIAMVGARCTKNSVSTVKCSTS